MAASVRQPDARQAAGSDCNFIMKEYKTLFTCYVCMMDSYESKRYRCDHCDLACHERCIQLDNNIELNSSPGSKWKGKLFKLHNKPQIRGPKTQSWASHCMVCGMPIKHYSYHFLTKKRKDINMHPYCAYLARDPDNNPEAGKKHCLWCNQERPNGACTEESYCWSYCLKKRDRGTPMHIHVYCYSAMVIQALKGINPLELVNNRSWRIVLQQKRSHGRDGSVWKEIAEEAIWLALEQLLGGGVSLIKPTISWIFH